MLRGIDEYDGAGVYIRKLLDALLELDRGNHYVLFYANDGQRGRYAHLPNVREVVVRAPGKLLWDQVAVPLAARRERLDVLFHHKFSIPLVAPCPTIVQQRGTEYWTFPEYYTTLGDRINRVYNVLSIPLFCRRAARVLTNSDSLARELEQVAGVPREKMATIYAAADERFTPITDPTVLGRVRAQYGIPDRPCFLMVVKGYARIEYAGQALCPRKNVEGTLEAYARARAAQPDMPPMVILGAGVRERLTPEVLRDALPSRSRCRRHPRPHRARRHARRLQHGGRAAVPVVLRKLRHPAGRGHGLRLPRDHLERPRLPRGGGRRRAHRRPR